MKLFKRVLAVMTARQKSKLIVLFVMMLIGAFLETIGTSLLLPFITVAMSPESIQDNENLAIVFDIFGFQSTNAFLLFLVVVLIGIYLGKNIYLYFLYYSQYKFIYDGQYETSRKLFREYVKRPYEFFLDASTPVMMRHIMSDVSGVYSLLLTMLQFMTEVIIFVALIIVSIVVNPVMTIIMGALLVGIILINKKVLGPILRKFGHQVQINSALTTKWMMQAINGIKEAKVLHKEDYFAEQYEKSAKSQSQILKKQNSLQNLPRLSIETVIMVGLLVLVGTLLLGGGSLNSMLGQIAVLAYVAMRIMPSANRLVSSINTMAYYEPSLTAVENIIQESNKKEAILIEKHETVPMTFEKEVALEHITYAYPNTDKNILQDAGVTIPIGKSVGFVGPSGAGKSTAVDILLGLLVPQSGKVTVDGVDITINMPGWYQKVGYVPQMIFMLDDTIRNNVAYGVDEKDISDEQVWYALKEAQLDEFVRTLPEGLNTSIGERGVRLSGGQRQRIGIARAMYTDPLIMIFDEATSALDNETEAAIMEAIERLHGRKTLLIIAHRLTTIEKCDAVYRVENQKFTRER
ncbi:MAG: ABC transporter ATP-binding protein [Lachnospiraceae bacterium]|nr:ABC transporter ATP-binding protein [Lachnospiraceae bacterium]